MEYIMYKKQQQKEIISFRLRWYGVPALFMIALIVLEKCL